MLAPDRAGEEEDVLEHHGDAAPQPGEVPLPHVDAVDPHGPGIHVVEAQQEVGQGALAGARMAHHGQGLARPHAEGDSLEDRLAGLVGEPDVFELDLPLHPLGKPGALGGGDGGRRVQQPEDALRARHGRLEDVVFLREVGERLVEPLGVLQEGDQGAHRDAPP